MIIDSHVFLGKTIYMEQSPETLIANMDRLEVAVSVVVAPPPGPFYSEVNEYVLNAMKKYPGRFVALYRANPHLDGEAEKCKEALKQGFSGLQLDPTNDGYGVGSEIMDPVVRLAEDAGVPVYIHSGDSIFCPPESIVDYATKFEEVKFVTNTSRRTFRAVSGCENLYIMSRPFPTLTFQRGYADRFDINRFVFASDAPLGMLEIELKSAELANLVEEQREKILGGNLKNIMKI
jgi:predicted TIM-barrel fold metal-dependent hydrolase